MHQNGHLGDIPRICVPRRGRRRSSGLNPLEGPEEAASVYTKNSATAGRIASVTLGGIG